MFLDADEYSGLKALFDSFFFVFSLSSAELQCMLLTENIDEMRMLDAQQRALAALDLRSQTAANHYLARIDSRKERYRMAMTDNDSLQIHASTYVSNLEELTEWVLQFNI